MIAGYDYLSLRLRMGGFWNKTRITAAGLLVTGGVLIGVGSAYYGYANDARSGLAKYEVNTVEIAPPWVPPAPAPVLEPFSLAYNPELSLYSGDAGVDPATLGPIIPEGFELIDSSDDAAPASVALATKMSISALQIDSTIQELSILQTDDRRFYETPNNTIGHIPETAAAGEYGEGWYFGHTESPVLDEGSVFFALQEIPDMLRKGQNIDIITDNGNEQFLYRVTGTRIVHEDDLVLESGGGPQIHLVSCVPRLVYDHRLIVDAELIARRVIT